ncbi:hypothetical protein Saro_3941 (plasmid) [Novosphingobium aromaticivorans DSM 12444]|jgi:hypothetical protein|uniref:DUF3768 domain-containing protein n=1 Tax=Novosphingobium aromaticivorans (strain ATCC 700278 / DSM 12444 / CCUG 56034 / CIP 105152 / NBRC 16084 / F199) TaxID=279238 RepID=A4XE22_NOVAD|nr:DUF3768 domain-containing protein [Novosphingobium aromaticivorans]ABP64183.1 hypothetical protein Saro_3941 [Novosphingobium aromaticivorans DSM 12444]SCY96606.1 Protein of unknown function [Novosphingobium aromaticivorans]
MTQLAQAAPADTDHTAEIAALNDAARAGSLVTSKTVFTRALADILAGEDPDPGTRQLNLMIGQGALRRLINETPIDPGNDPHGERDFGVVEYQGHKIFWKVDVYANDGTFAWGSETPWDAQQSFRVVTIMLASDW